MPRKRPAHRTLALEILETRSLLSGNVSVALVGTNLIIKGDNLDNKFSVAETAADTF